MIIKMSTERAIQASYMANRPSEYRLRKNALRLNKQHPFGTISIAELCRESDLSRRAFYNQYTSLSDFYAHCKKDFEDEMNDFLAELLKNNFSLGTSIFKILTFIERYHVLFRGALMNDDFSLIRLLMLGIKPVIMDAWREEVILSGISYVKLTRFYRVLTFRLVEKIDVWIRWQNCEKSEMLRLQNDILTLIKRHKAQLVAE